jgi:spore coat protein CotH
MNVRSSIWRHVCLTAALAAAIGSLTLAQTTSPGPVLAGELFDSTDLQRVDLRVNSSDWLKLKENFRSNDYYPADVVYNGQTVRNTGIRSRGLGSRSDRKPGLRVDMDRYSDDQTFLGEKSFILDNLTQDPSTVHETVTMKLFARLGIPAPRESHVRLYVNNEFAGVYAAVESIDKHFLARIFGSVGDDTQNDGYLFEFNFVDPWYFTNLGSDLEQYKLRFDAKTKEDKSDQDKYGPIEELVRLANDVPIDQFQAQIGPRLDLPALMRYVAAQAYVAQNDGFLGYEGMNNFYFYRLEGSPQHVFLAWDEDNAFDSTDFPVTTRQEENVLVRKAMQVPELREAFYNGLRAAIASADEPTGPNQVPWLEYEVTRQLDLVAQAVRDDQNKPYSVVDHEAARAAMIAFAQNRSRIVREQLR